MRVPAEINNDEELEASTNALFQLTALDNPSRSEREAIELLTLLAEHYQEKYYPVPAADAIPSLWPMASSHRSRPLALQSTVRKSGRFTILCPFAGAVWYVYIEPSVSSCMSLATSHSPLVTVLKCPNCNSTDLKKISLIYAAGVVESRGRIGGMLFGNGAAFFIGKYRGANQSLLSKIACPPRKAPYLAPVILWLMGFFIVMAFAGRGRLLEAMAIFSVPYLLVLPGILVGTLAYNLFVYPEKCRRWESKFLCQHCGSSIPELQPRRAHGNGAELN